tara:strand:+ start:2804 stop:3262 length:459 start_codon:yes stop_codon:yes gene_type:complete
MGVLITSDYLLNYHPSNTSASLYIEKNIDIFKEKLFGISGSLQYVSGSENSAYFNKNITYTFTGSNSRELNVLKWVNNNVGYNEGIHLTMSIYNTSTNKSKLYKCDTRSEQKEPWVSYFRSMSMYPPSSTLTSEAEVLEYLSSSAYISASNK